MEVAKTLPEDAAIAQAETTAVAEAAKAICCLIQSGYIRFDRDGRLMEDWDENHESNKNG